MATKRNIQTISLGSCIMADRKIKNANHAHNPNVSKCIFKMKILYCIVLSSPLVIIKTYKNYNLQNCRLPSHVFSLGNSSIRPFSKAIHPLEM